VTASHLNDRNAFRGAWPALLTPLDAQLRIDHDKFAAHAKERLANGCMGVTLFGTTGEGPSFSLVERREALTMMIARGVPAERIMVSTSCAALPETLELTRHAVDAGVHGCLMLPPFFLKGVSDEGILACYEQVLAGMPAQGWRLYLYHIPQVAAVGLSHAVIGRLIERHRVIAGIKDSACDRAHSVGLAQAFMPPISVYVGYEPDLPTLGRLGSTGAISGLANFFGRVVTRMVLEPDAPGTARDAQRVDAMLDLLKPHSLMPALKSVMATLYQDPGWLRVRAPLMPLSAQAHAEFSATIEAFGIDRARE
jgi:4-hydroxy-tetrahydrodipicolinate synthase